MNHFTLYDNLKTTAQHTPIKSDHFKKTIMEFVKSSTNRSHHNILYALIKHHENRELNTIQCSVPYMAEHHKNNDMRIDLNKLPEMLIVILYLYITRVREEISETQ